MVRGSLPISISLRSRMDVLPMTTLPLDPLLYLASTSTRLSTPTSVLLFAHFQHCLNCHHGPLPNQWPTVVQPLHRPLSHLRNHPNPLPLSCLPGVHSSQRWPRFAHCCRASSTSQKSITTHGSSRRGRVSPQSGGERPRTRKASNTPGTTEGGEEAI